ncbi:MAG: hypothetical protein RIE32_12785 [Phycisphaerales bacterium]
MTTLPAASISVTARHLIDAFIERGRRDVLEQLAAFTATLRQNMLDDAEAQRRLTMIRLRTGTMLSRFDLYADVLTQRSEHRVGIWLAGLEAAAEDGLVIEGVSSPPVVCYLDRGGGAAIRRARTRLPGGEVNPVALVRIPRERMIGSGVASSLIHEAGHQGMELLDLVPSIRPVLEGFEAHRPQVWSLWKTWISEILADFWSVARLGPAAVLGVMSVVSLPRAFVFRIGVDDPHPFPYIRVRLGCAMARELYPHQQWDQLDAIWRRLYPLEGLDAPSQRIIAGLSETLPALARLISEHRPPRLGGRSLRQVLACPCKGPERLRRTVVGMRSGSTKLDDQSPCRALAVLGQAKLDKRLAAAKETRILERLLTHWALTRTRNEVNTCAAPAA